MYIQKTLAPKLGTFLTQLQQIPLTTGLPNSLYKITTSLISFFHTPPPLSCRIDVFHFQLGYTYLKLCIA